MKMGANSLDIFMKNLGTDEDPLIGSVAAKPSLYKAEMERAAQLMDWKAKWPGIGLPYLGWRCRPVELHGQNSP